MMIDQSAAKGYSCVLISVVFLLSLWPMLTACGQQQQPWLHYQPVDSKEKKIVLISGDEEYRSEESLPMLAKLLAERHGFETIVLFAIDPETGAVDPEYQHGIPGLEQLQDADLMLIATRFRALPDEQMKWIDDYLRLGKPVIGLRTATHAFNFSEESSSAFKHYGFNTSEGDWVGGFGRFVLGETWIDHHGDHGTEGTRVLLDGPQAAAEHPILRGVRDIWVPSDVYGIRNTLQDATVLLYGQPTAGMDAKSPIIWQKSSMPVAWTRSYQISGGKPGNVFTTTMGASVDLKNEDLRRLLVNAVYWTLGFQDAIDEELSVDPIGKYEPTMFGFGSFKKDQFPSDYR
ncbi:MAG: ThuA domain-containing protein [Sphingobacterium sp.]